MAGLIPIYDSDKTRGLANSLNTMAYQGIISDLNTTKQGVFRFYSDSLNLPMVGDLDYFIYGGMLVNFNIGTDAYIMQIMMPMGYPNIFVRQKVDSWRGWVEL